MEPTITKGSVIYTRPVASSELRRGDIIIFGRPPNEPDNGVSTIVKRIVALPGETLEVRDCKVFINGRPLDEPYVKQWSRTCTFSPKAVGAGEVFVLGDNRDERSAGGMRLVTSARVGPELDDLCARRFRPGDCRSLVHVRRFWRGAPR